MLDGLVKQLGFLLYTAPFECLLDQADVRDEVRCKLASDATERADNFVNQVLVEFLLRLQNAQELVDYLGGMLTEG